MHRRVENTGVRREGPGQGAWDPHGETLEVLEIQVLGTGKYGSVVISVGTENSLGLTLFHAY